MSLVLSVITTVDLCTPQAACQYHANDIEQVLSLLSQHNSKYVAGFFVLFINIYIFFLQKALLYKTMDNSSNITELIMGN